MEIYEKIEYEDDTTKEEDHKEEVCKEETYTRRCTIRRRSAYYGTKLACMKEEVEVIWWKMK